MAAGTGKIDRMDKGEQDAEVHKGPSHSEYIEGCIPRADASALVTPFCISYLDDCHAADQEAHLDRSSPPLDTWAGSWQKRRPRRDSRVVELPCFWRVTHYSGCRGPCPFSAAMCTPQAALTYLI